MSLQSAIRLLKECHRVLVPGGIISAAVPNARIFISAYCDANRFDTEKYCVYTPAYDYNSKIDYINYIAYMDDHHTYIFDEENIIAILRRAGFKEARLRNFDSSIDLESRRAVSIYAQAEK